MTRLQREAAATRSQSQQAVRQFEELMVENEALSEKLEHLEDAFVHGADDGAWSRVGSVVLLEGVDALLLIGLVFLQPEHAPAPPSDAPAGSPVRMKAALAKVVNDNAALREQLAEAERAMERLRVGGVGTGDGTTESGSGRCVWIALVEDGGGAPVGVLGASVNVVFWWVVRRQGKCAAATA